MILHDHNIRQRKTGKIASISVNLIAVTLLGSGVLGVVPEFKKIQDLNARFDSIERIENPNARFYSCKTNLSYSFTKHSGGDYEDDENHQPKTVKECKDEMKLEGANVQADFMIDMVSIFVGSCLGLFGIFGLNNADSGAISRRQYLYEL